MLIYLDHKTKKELIKLILDSGYALVDTGTIYRDGHSSRMIYTVEEGKVNHYYPSRGKPHVKPPGRGEANIHVEAHLAKCVSCGKRILFYGPDKCAQCRYMEKRDNE